MSLAPRFREGRPADSEWLEGFCAVTDGEAASTAACERQEQGSVPLGAKFNIRTRHGLPDLT